MNLHKTVHPAREKLRRVYFGFTVADRYAAKQWLEEQAADGWELVRLKPGYFSWAYFRPLERAGLRYGVDVADNGLRAAEHREAYAAFLAESGWEPVAQLGPLAVYRALPGMDPPPIHTDPELERKRFFREVRLPVLLCWLLVPLFLALVYLGLSQNGPVQPYFFLCKDSLLAYLCAALLLLLWTLGGLGLRLLRRARRVPHETDPHKIRTRALRGAVFAACLSTALFLCVTAAQYSALLGPSPYLSDAELRTRPVILAADPAERATYAREVADSVLIQSLRVQQFLPDGRQFYEHRFDCRFPWVADLVLSGQLAEAAHDGYALRPAELGPERAYAAENGTGSCLVLREGNVVVLLKGPGDLTGPAFLSELWTALQWEV